jgi:two-component system cell cycle sensor histidine kinase PleC
VLLPQALDAGRIAADCASLVARAAGERDVAVEIQGDAAPVHADELALRQILINLLSNAVKFTPDGGRVAVGIAAAPAGGTEITVADTGPGMDEDGIRTALDPFGQVDGPYGDLRTAADIGTGLGLPIAVRLVEMHGGRFDIESAPGRGTTIRIWLPSP